MPGIAPYKMGRFSVRIDNPDIRAVGVGRQHACPEATQSRGSPAMKEDKSRAVGVEQQVVEVVFGVFRIAGDLAEFGNIRKGDD